MAVAVAVVVVVVVVAAARGEKTEALSDRDCHFPAHPNP